MNETSIILDLREYNEFDILKRIFQVFCIKPIVVWEEYNINLSLWELKQLSKPIHQLNLKKRIYTMDMIIYNIDNEEEKKYNSCIFSKILKFENYELIGLKMIPKYYNIEYVNDFFIIYIPRKWIKINKNFYVDDTQKLLISRELNNDYNTYLFHFFNTLDSYSCIISKNFYYLTWWFGYFFNKLNDKLFPIVDFWIIRSNYKNIDMWNKESIFDFPFLWEWIIISPLMNNKIIYYPDFLNCETYNKIEMDKITYKPWFNMLKWLLLRSCTIFIFKKQID